VCWRFGAVSRIGVAGFSLQHGYYSNLTAPDDGYVNGRNMLSTYEVKENSKWHQVGLLFFSYQIFASQDAFFSMELV